MEELREKGALLPFNQTTVQILLIKLQRTIIIIQKIYHSQSLKSYLTFEKQQFREKENHKFALAEMKLALFTRPSVSSSVCPSIHPFVSQSKISEIAFQAFLIFA